MQTPRGKKVELVPSALAAPGVHGELRSATTRRNGLVAATDIAPTVLRYLGLRVPDAMQGEPIEGRGKADPASLRKLANRLAVITARRGYSLRWVLIGWLALLVVFGFATGWPGLRAATRIGLLGALWLPAVALADAAIAPASRGEEAAILAGGSLLLGAVTDLTVRWPAGPAVPVFVSFVAHAIDLARGSPLIARSIAGPNPAGGARFYGIGNELEPALPILLFVGLAAAMTGRERSRELAGWFAGCGLVLALAV